MAKNTLGVTVFVPGDKGELMCYWEGRVAFPDRHGTQPEAEKYYEVIDIASNPKKTVYFLKLGERRDDLKMVSLQSFDHGNEKELFVDGDIVEGLFPACWNVYSVLGWVGEQLPKIHSGLTKSYRQGFFQDNAPILCVIKAAETLKAAKESQNRYAFEEALGVMIRKGALEFRHARSEMDSFLFELPGGGRDQCEKDKIYIKKIFLPALVSELSKNPDFRSVTQSMDGNLMLFPTDEVKDQYTSWRVEFSYAGFSPLHTLGWSWGKGFDYRDGVETVAEQVVKASKKA